MIDKVSLFNYLKEDKQYDKLQIGKDFNCSSIEAFALLVGLSYLENKRKIFVLLSDIYQAETFVKFITNTVDESEVYLYTYDDIFRTNALGVSKEMQKERLLSISSTLVDKPSVLVAHTSSFMLDICDQNRYKKELIDLKISDMIYLNDLIKRLEKIGYTRVDRITNINQYALRGGILDICDPSYSSPYRIELFGDEIDDIRQFDIRDELSFSHQNKLLIHPCSLKILNDDEISSGIDKIDEEIKTVKIVDRLSFDDLVYRANLSKENVKKGYLDEIDSRFYPYFIKESSTLNSYISEYEKISYNREECYEKGKEIKKKERDYFSKSFEKNCSLKEERVYSDKAIDIDCYINCSTSSDEFLLRENSYKAVSYHNCDQLINSYLNEGYKIRVVLPEANLMTFSQYLKDKDITYTEYPIHSKLMLVNSRLNHGFELPEYKHVYLSAKEIFGASDNKTRFLSRYKEAKIINRYEDLQEGDFVVHEIHGVGRYDGVETINGLEYLKIHYAQDQVLFLPLSQYKLIRKYSSREGYTPALDKMGGSTWSRKKSRIRSRISYIADQLLLIYAERESKPGYAFAKERELEEEFCSSFYYPYTNGQKDAIKDVLSDMESSHPMDRLIAGDVGFGKTEIAFVAAFKAIANGKQVLFLCPTTILSKQHYKVAIDRFKDFTTKIKKFDRFTTDQEKREIKDGLKSGKIDMVIGTHALLSDDISFKDLGLLIIDEEQKFGVTHKEKIKERYKNIDCLTLTATPIPRTMQMSLLGMRNISLLSDSPLNRMPVKTYVMRYDEELIYEVIEKELDRKGQVYYLHNRIEDINSTAKRLQKRFKDKKIGIVHARMDQDEIELVMDKFYQCQIDILVCTSIIESGLDIPNVNTIIVENADRFGLSQLYQIKGRVGRSDRLAYAYFFYQREEKLTDEASKRLKALKDFTELGSGYKVAMQDLNIRGAGDILGSEQAGFVDSLGYDAYIDLLKKVIDEKKIQTNNSVQINERFELSFTLDAHIPEDYGTKNQRITMYRELSDCKSKEELEKFSKKLIDVYGSYSQEVDNLFTKRMIEIYANRLEVDNFVEKLGLYYITMSEEYSSKIKSFKELENRLKDLFGKLRLKVEKNRLVFLLTKTKDYLQDLMTLFTNLFDDTIN